MRKLFRNGFCGLLVLLVSCSSASGSTSYTVKQGDTLDSIAQANKTSIEELIMFNKLPPVGAVEGQVLNIPDETDAKSFAKAEAPATDSRVSLKMLDANGKNVGELYVDGKLVFRIRGAIKTETVQERSETVRNRLAAMILQGNDPKQIKPAYAEGVWYVSWNGTPLITIDRESVILNNMSDGEVAFSWANNLRQALGANELGLSEINTEAKATYYAKGNRTSSGEAFLPDAITAAHRTLPFGTRVLVSDLATKKSVIVKINDRGPFVDRYQIDLSRGAARSLGNIGRGVFDVKIHVLDYVEEK